MHSIHFVQRLEGLMLTIVRQCSCFAPI